VPPQSDAGGIAASRELSAVDLSQVLSFGFDPDFDPGFDRDLLSV